jgi:hypothetical protein
MNRATVVCCLSAVTATFVALIGAPALGRVGAAAFVRGAHFSPDTAGVDVYLTAFSGGTSTLWLSDVGYGGAALVIVIGLSRRRRHTPGR